MKFSEEEKEVLCQVLKVNEAPVFENFTKAEKKVVLQTFTDYFSKIVDREEETYPLIKLNLKLSLWCQE